MEHPQVIVGVPAILPLGNASDFGSPGWIRTSDHSINSQPLFHFAALQGISPKLRSALFC
jgi:hypothetical protein